MPGTKPGTKKKDPIKGPKRSFRGAVLTIWDMTWDCQLPERMQFIAFGKEVCPETKRDHYQAFAYAKDKMKLTGWNKVLKHLTPHTYVEEMSGNLYENEDYCEKEGQYTKIGVPPMPNGKQRSMEEVKHRCDQIKDGESVMDIAEDPELFQTVSRMTPFLKEYIQHVRSKKVKRDFSAPEVTYIWGSPGTGKTRLVAEKEENLYTVPNGHKDWRDNYALHEAVLFDNMEGDRIIDRSAFLQQIDRYPIYVPVKGTHVWWKPKRIYITSLVPPEIFAKNFEHANEFKRRLTKIIHLPLDHESTDNRDRTDECTRAPQARPHSSAAATPPMSPHRLSP